MIWAYNSTVEEVTRGQGSVIPTSREQIVQSLDPGTIKEMRVKEGDVVEKGQILLTLDDTRSAAVLRESEAKVANLEAMAARLRAESYGTAIQFPAGISPDLQRRERAAYEARRRAVDDAVSGLQQSKAMLDREIGITAPMVAEGVMSEVELLRMRRQSSDLALQINEKRNQYAADANNELVRIESELAWSQREYGDACRPCRPQLNSGTITRDCEKYKNQYLGWRGSGGTRHYGNCSSR